MVPTFFEWLQKKKGITFTVDEGMGRLAQMTHDELPDSVPQSGHVVIVMDKPKANVTNDDIYIVNSNDGNEVSLTPKKGMTLGLLKIPRQMWKEFTLVNHLLTQNEKMTKFSGKPVWIVGASKDKWIANREAELRKQGRQRMQSPGVHTPQDVDPIKLAQVRQQLTAGRGQEEPDVTAARNWLRGS
jgi:hypothetical protein